MTRALIAAAVLVTVLATVLTVAPAGAGVADDYEPGPCIRNDGIGPAPFGDLASGAFYEEPVRWAFGNDIVNGTSPTTFDPDRTVTRGEFAAMLHRSVCLPIATVTAPFVDLRAGAFYLPAIDWLFEEALTTGIAPGQFGPERPMTRAEFATFLFRLVGEPAGAPPAGFSDVDSGAWYAAAVDWLLYRGVTTGISPGMFGPDRLITRGEVVTFLARLNTILDVPAHFVTLLSGLSSPVAIEQNPVTGTWFIAEKGGTLVRWSGGTAVDVTTISVSGGSEQGLLGVAIPADGSHIYLSYTNTNTDGDSRVDEYELNGDAVDLGSRREIIAVDQPATNHNGGDISFGPDGFLYYGLGDGGRANDTFGNGQNTSTLLGSILRIDPSAPGGGKAYGIPLGNPFAFSAGVAEIWLYGVRNPWRFSFDMETGDLWVADVGQSSHEEFTRMTGAEPGKGANLGWPRWEGALEWPGRTGPDPGDHVGPVHEYNPSGPQSVTGGFVYRGDDIPALEGTYLWADFFDPAVMGWRDAFGIESETVTSADGMATAFGQDTDGEVYVLTIDGRLRKLVPG